jgi:hypothetical protein
MYNMRLTIKRTTDLYFQRVLYSYPSICQPAITKSKMAQKQAVKTNQAITLKGSTAMVSEFFEYSVNSILYQRGVYPSDDFRYATPLTHGISTDKAGWSRNMGYRC